MIMRRISLILLFSILSISGINAEDYISLLDKGNDAFDAGDYKKALDYYHEAEIVKPETAEIEYNLANTLLQTGKYEEAVEKYGKALNSDNIDLQGNAYYNMGCADFVKGDYQAAIGDFTEALKINPEDVDAKYNLEAARKLLKEQLEQEKKEQQEGGDQEEKQKQEQEDQKKQDEEGQEKQDSPKDEPNDEEKKQEQKQQGQPPDSGDMSEEDALRILQALEDEQNKNQPKKKIKVKGNYRGRDW